LNLRKLSTRIALVLSIVLLFASTVQTTLGVMVTKTGTLVNVFMPFETIVNDILLNKTVEHPLGNDYTIPSTVAFDFKVELGDFYRDTEIETTAGTVKTDGTGSLTVTVAPGKPFGINGIDAGTKVKVTELVKAGSGFAPKDGAEREVTVGESGGVVIDYINVYTPASVSPVSVFLTVNKTLEGRDWKDGDAFSFLLEQNLGGDNWKAVGTKNVTYDKNNDKFNTVSFDDLLQSLVFEAVGTYQFRVSEVKSTLENVDYDDTVSYFSVVVTDFDMDGTLEISNVTGSGHAAVLPDGSGKFNIDVAFHNVFVPDNISIPVTVLKTVKNTGTKTITPEGFSFLLEDPESGYRLTLKTDKDGKAIFDLPFTARDIGKTYTYTLSEVNDGVENVTYDTAKYEISVSIAQDANGNLKATVKVNGTEVSNCTAAFENIYEANDPEVPPTTDQNLTFWILMTVASLILCAVLFVIDRKLRRTARA